MVKEQISINDNLSVIDTLIDEGKINSNKNLVFHFIIKYK